MQQMPSYGPPPVYYAPQRQPSQMPVIGGVLLLLAGILGFVGAAQVFVASGAGSYFGVFGPEIAGILAVCGLLLVIFSVFALLGGIMAVQRKMWGLALAGGILGLFAIGPFFLSSLLSLIGLIIIGISREDFEGQSAPPMVAPMVQPMPMQPMYPPTAYPQPMQPMAPQHPAQSAGGAWKYCSNCGNQVAATAANCPRCGAKIA
ncbi:MAG TPA: zinc ribbon domain-containing protein [Thermoplasmata archaeon]|nr:zinc ribbon domain-containing protein [Thermoplasmata archaeon]